MGSRRSADGREQLEARGSARHSKYHITLAVDGKGGNAAIGWSATTATVCSQRCQPRAESRRYSWPAARLHGSHGATRHRRHAAVPMCKHSCREHFRCPRLREMHRSPVERIKLHGGRSMML